MSITFKMFLSCASTWSKLQEEAKPGFRKSQVARETACSDLLNDIFPQAVCVGETLSKKSLSWICNCRAHTNGGVQQRTLLRRVLRRVLEIAFEKVLRRVLRRCLAVGFNGKKGSKRGS